VKDFDVNKVIASFKQYKHEDNSNIEQDMKIVACLIQGTSNIIGTERIDVIKDYLLGDPEGEDILSEHEEGNSEASDDDSDAVSIDEMNDFMNACNKLGIVSNLETVFVAQQTSTDVEEPKKLNQ
jgi:hypothetical protein